MFADLWTGTQVLFSDWNILILVAGTAWGIFSGALPGITGSIGVALILPFTFGMDAASAIILLCASYAGSMFGGSISTILLGAPGTASAAATLLDGRELHKQGKSGLAVGTALCASTIGGVIGALILIFFCTPLAKLALAFGPPEYFALGIFGLTVLSALSGKEMVRGVIAGVFGMMIATVGLDPFSGMARYTLGRHELLNGLDLLPVLIGLFALGEMFSQVGQRHTTVKIDEQYKVAAKLPGLGQLYKLKKSIALGGVLGTLIGVMPGAGGAIGSWVSYGQAKKFSKEPEKFGKGSLEGIAAPEAANSASEGGSLVPMLALGIPGSNTTAIMLGALTLQGIQPGPMLFIEHADVAYSVYMAVLLTNFVVLGLGIMALKPVLQITRVQPQIVITFIFILICAGAYSIQNSLFDVGVAVFFGVVGLLMKKFKFPVAAAVLGLVLGPIIEPALQRSLLLSDGNPMIFFSRPISATILIVSIGSVLAPLLLKFWKKHRSV